MQRLLSLINISSSKSVFRFAIKKKTALNWNMIEKYIVNSGKSSKRAFSGPRSSEPICSCSAQRSFEACRSYDFARELLRAFQGLFKSKISINAFILWKLRPVFRKCSWSIGQSLVNYTGITSHTHAACASSSRENWLNRLILLLE